MMSMGALLIHTGNYMWGPVLIVFAPLILGFAAVYAVRYVVNGNTRPVWKRRYF